MVYDDNNKQSSNWHHRYTMLAQSWSNFKNELGRILATVPHSPNSGCVVYGSDRAFSNNVFAPLPNYHLTTDCWCFECLFFFLERLSTGCNLTCYTCDCRL